jgi:transformation/transcription domain-associated protein
MTLSNHPQVLASLCCCLALLESLQEVFTPQTMLMYMPLVIKALHKAARELNQQAQQAAAIAAQQRRAMPLLGNPSGEPEYGTLSWAVTRCLRLCAPRTLNHPDHHKLVLGQLVSLLVGQYTRFMDPCVFLEVLDIVERWVLRPYPDQQGTLTVKETILVCQRLGLLEKQNILANVEPTLRAKIEGAFHKLLHQLCTQPSLPKVSTVVATAQQRCWKACA